MYLLSFQYLCPHMDLILFLQYVRHVFIPLNIFSNHLMHLMFHFEHHLIILGMVFYPVNGYHVNFSISLCSVPFHSSDNVAHAMPCVIAACMCPPILNVSISLLFIYLILYVYCVCIYLSEICEGEALGPREKQS